ncbi:MAG: protein kinase [Planctomycetes bacterium]|nr:protein kinase [Planctomycetota bacterium]
MPAVPEPPTSLPADAGPYTFLAEIGRGAMGTVYRALDRESGREVAIKVISGRHAQGPHALERFEREARMAASISHRNCVFVYGACRVGEQPAIVMELLVGDSLASVIERDGPASVERAVHWTLQVLDGLEAVHRAQLIHRDLKPGNVFVDHDGSVKIGDFGLSRRAEADAEITNPGGFVGSPMYASPEQVRGRKLDLRSDLYSVAATLYVLLSGKTPFRADSIGDLFAQIATEPPIALRSVAPTVPRALERVVLQGLEKDPEDRFQTIDDFRDALAPFAEEAQRIAPAGPRLAAYAFDALFCALLLTGVSVLWKEISPDTHPVNVPLAWRLFALGTALTMWHWALESRSGRTLGKALFGLRVSTANGDPPSPNRAFWRAVIVHLPTYVIPAPSPYAPLAALYWVPLLGLARRRTGYRAVHDMLTRTIVVSERPRRVRLGQEVARFQPTRSRRPEDPERIGPYAVTGFLAETAQGVLYLAYDERLERDVWIHRVPAPCDRLPEERRAHAGTLAVRWLDGANDSSCCYDVYEALGGASLDEYERKRRGLDWRTARRALLDLCDELLERPRRLSHHQLWIDAQGRIHVVELPLGDGTHQALPALPLVAHTAATLLVARRRSEIRLPSTLPDGASAVMHRLLESDWPYSTLAELRSSLFHLEADPRALPWPIRAVQLLAGSAAALLLMLPIALLLLPGGAISLTLEQGVLLPGLTRAAVYELASLVIALGVTLPTSLLAFLSRGGLTFSLLKVRVVDRQGHRTSRSRCALRSLVAFLPASALLLAAAQLERFEHPLMAAILVATTAVLYASAAMLSILRPSQSLADRITVTYLVR